MAVKPKKCFKFFCPATPSYGGHDVRWLPENAGNVITELQDLISLFAHSKCWHVCMEIDILVCNTLGADLIFGTACRRSFVHIFVDTSFGCAQNIKHAVLVRVMVRYFRVKYIFQLGIFSTFQLRVQIVLTQP